MPASWPEYAVTYRFGAAEYDIVVEQPALVAARGAAVTVDGVARPDAWIPLVDDGARHAVRVAPAA